MTRSCPRCGSPGGAAVLTAGLCPACLLTAALDDDEGACPYRVLAPMADGDEGVTYLAQALRGDRRYVALKVYDRHPDVSGAVARFTRWKPALDSVQHASLARVLDVGVTPEGLLYIASEFVAGWPLATARTAALEARSRHLLAWQLADAVAALHAGGVAHLALTPDHVKVSTSSGPRATILSVGVPLVVDGLEPAPGRDLPALLRLVREQLAIPLPPGSQPTSAALRDALSTGL